MWIVYQEERENMIITPYPFGDPIGWLAWQFFVERAIFHNRRVWLEWRKSGLDLQITKQVERG